MSASFRVKQRLVPLVLAGLLAAASVHVSCAGCARRSLERPQVAATVGGLMRTGAEHAEGEPLPEVFG